MQERKLAAIMFSDIVGYTSLMGSDEKKAFDFLRTNRRIHWRLIKKYKGKWLKEMGDGTLASFSSNMDAIMCALAIQKAAKEMNIPLRIGIHQGDVIFEKKDVLGDGVNIASRIQALADKNGIVISETVYHEIKNKEGLEVEYKGEESLKGVKKPMGIYKITIREDGSLDYSIDTGELVRPLSTGRKPIITGIVVIALMAFTLYIFLPKIINPNQELGKSVLILPFDNYTGTDTLDYFIAGMHNSLIKEVQKISSLRVPSMTTANAYENLDLSIPEIASETKVNYIVESSILSLGDSINLQTKLLRAYPEEKQIWIQDFKVDIRQVLNLYKTITRAIIEAMGVELSRDEEDYLAESRTVDPEAYNAFLKGQYYRDQYDIDSLQKSMDYFQIAINKNPDWSDPYAGLALAWAQAGFFGIVPQTLGVSKTNENINKALEIDADTSAYIHFIIALTVTAQWDWKRSEREFLRSLKLNPNDALCRAYYAQILMMVQQIEQSVEQANQAVELDPDRPIILSLSAVVMRNAGDNQAAISLLEKALSINPDYKYALGNLAWAYYDNGDYDKWFNVWKEIVCWNDSIKTSIDRLLQEEGPLAAVKGLLKANEEFGTSGCKMTQAAQVSRYLLVKDYEKALDHLEIMYDTSDPQLSYIGTNLSGYNYLKDSVRYIALLKKMNLPVD